MLEDLFIHLCIVITFIFIGGMFFKKSPYIINIRMKLFLGMLAGILGSLLLYFSIQLDEDTIMDMRHIAIIISSIYGGFISAVVSAVIIAISRLVIFGVSFSAVTAASGTIIVGLVIGMLYRVAIPILYKWILMLIISSGIYSGVLYLLIGYSDIFYQILGYFWLLSLVSGYVAYYFSNYIYKSNQLSYDYKQQATVDFLTGLNNSRQFNMLLTELLLKAAVRKQDLSLIYFDIDYFKTINDTYGHPAGDKVLKDIGQILMNVTRSHALLFRTGGEEFSIIMPETDLQQAAKFAETIRTTVEEHLFILPDGTSINCTISMGIGAKSIFEAATAEELTKKADDALYKAKKEGRNKVCWESSEIFP